MNKNDEARMTNDEKKTSDNVATVRHSSFVLRHFRLSLPSRGKLLLLLSSIVVALLVGELGVRLIGQAPEIISIGVSSDEHVYRRSTNPILSYEFKPGFRSDKEDLAFDYRAINSHGLRDVEREYAKPPGTKRIILLGDSVVVGYRIKEIDQLMSRQLEMLYGDSRGRRHGDENVEVLNVAVTGYCTRAEVELLRVQAVKYDPDAVILVFVENDFRNFNPESVGADGVANRPAAAAWMFRRSHLFRLACVQFNWFSFGLEADPASWNQEAIGDNNVAEGLALLRELADEHGFRPLVAVWPAFEHDGIEYPDKMFMPDGEELIVERLARGHDLPVVGLREAFRDHWQQQTPRPLPRQYYSVGDEMHASVDGHRVAAEILRRMADEYHLLEPPERQTARTTHASDDGDALRAAKALGMEKAGYGLLHINRAVTLHDEGKLDEAVEQLEKVDASDSRNYGNASVTLALILAQQGKVDRAKSRLQKVLAAPPDHFQARMVLASLFNAEGADEKEIEQLQRAVDLRPDSYDARLHLGLTLARLRRWKQAEPHLSAAARLDPNNAAAARQLALALANQGEFSRAVVQFERLIQLDPQTGQNYVELGAALNMLRRSEQSMLVFRKGLVVDADNAELHRRLGLTLARRDELNEASVHLRRAVELAPGSVEASNGLAQLFVRQGRKQEAVAQLRRSLELDPDNKTAQANLDRLQTRRP